MTSHDLMLIAPSALGLLTALVKAYTATITTRHPRK